ncbi:hypothetical protein Tco_1254234 [Tanacetum coccineum]
MKVEESLNVTFDESPPPTKLSPLVDDGVGEEEAIENNIKVVNNNNIEDESVEVHEEAFGGNTRDLCSFGEETDKITTLHRSGFKNYSQSLETASQFPSDTIRSYKKQRQNYGDDVRTLMVMAPRNYTILLNTKVSLKGLSLASIGANLDRSYAG